MAEVLNLVMTTEGETETNNTTSQFCILSEQNTPTDVRVVSLTDVQVGTTESGHVDGHTENNREIKELS